MPLSAVLVGVLGVGVRVLLQLGVGLLEGVRDVLQEDETEDDVLGTRRHPYCRAARRPSATARTCSPPRRLRRSTWSGLWSLAVYAVSSPSGCNPTVVSVRPRICRLVYSVNVSPEGALSPRPLRLARGLRNQAPPVRAGYGSAFRG